MRLLHAGVDTTVIALRLGHEQVETTQMYLPADLALKENVTLLVSQTFGTEIPLTALKVLHSAGFPSWVIDKGKSAICICFSRIQALKRASVPKPPGVPAAQDDPRRRLRAA